MRTILRGSEAHWLGEANHPGQRKVRGIGTPGEDRLPGVSMPSWGKQRFGSSLRDELDALKGEDGYLFGIGRGRAGVRLKEQRLVEGDLEGVKG